MAGETAAVSCLVVVLVRLPTTEAQVQGWTENDSDDDEESDDDDEDDDED